MKNLFVLLTMFLSVSINSQDKRLAIVIGNSAYEHGGVLTNPVNDAVAMKVALGKVGFEVLPYFDLDEGELKKAIDEFGLKLRNYDVGLFFYAGHGIQAKGENYLIPIEANLMSEQQVEYDCVDAARVLAHMDASGASVNIVILDACRNNPFERSWSRTASGKGLAFMDAPAGTLIAYATSPGKTASDGTGENGLYTEAILESMQAWGINILQMFQNVRKLVSQRSNKQQIPWESTSLIGDFYFNREAVFDNSNQDVYNPVMEVPDTSIISPGITEDRMGHFIDDRDGKVYKWVCIGEQIWMAENLNFHTDSGSCCYNNYESYCNKYGRLYNWPTAFEVCPDGWHLPSEEEWRELEWTLGMPYNVIDNKRKKTRGTTEGGKIKSTGIKHWLSPNEGATDEFGFSALPGGTCIFNQEGTMAITFTGIGNSASFCSSSLREHREQRVWIRMLTSYSSAINRFSLTTGIGISVRCVKDSP